MKKTIIGAFIILIVGIIIIAIVSIGEKDKLLNKIDKLEKELIEKQRTIESQADMLMERDREACPEWIEDFYYDHVCDEDGCEVRE